MDTGAYINIIPKTMLKMFKIDKPGEALEEISIVGSKARVTGKEVGEVEFNEMIVKETFKVMENNNKEILIGLPTIKI